MSVYIATATRKRPKTFETLVGQEFVSSTLRESIKKGTIAQTYLFSGPRGVGKTTSARALARALNCEQGPTPTPCGVCASCLGMDSSNSLDIVEIDGASHTSIQDIREIKEEIRFNPTSGRYRIYIIDEVHMLSNSAFNGLLKTLEEPPSYVIFILATTELHKIPATVKSRCQQFHFNLIAFDEILDLLTQATDEMGLTADEDALIWIAKESTGSLRDAYTLFDQVVAFSDQRVQLTVIQEKLGLLTTEKLKELVLLLAQGDRNHVFTLFNLFLGGGVALEQIHHDLTEFLRGLLLFKNGVTKTEILGSPAADFEGAINELWETSQLEKALSWSFETYRRLRYSLNPRFEIELMLSQLCDLKHHLTPSQIWHEISRLEGSLLESPLDLNSVKTPEITAPLAPPSPQEPMGPNLEDVTSFFTHYAPELISGGEKTVFIIESPQRVVKVMLHSQYEENIFLQKREMIQNNWQKNWSHWQLVPDTSQRDPKEKTISEVEGLFNAQFIGEDS